MEENELRKMKDAMIERGNWKEVSKINKMLEMNGFKITGD